MFCKNCGKQVSEDSNYCPYCGAYLMDNNINSKEEDPRVSKSSLFHSVNPTDNNSNSKLNVNKLLHPKLTKKQKINDVISIINTIISFVALMLMFIMLAFISDLISFNPNRYPFILGIVIPIIICVFINTFFNTYFLVLVIKYKMRLFRMLGLRVVSIILSLSSSILLCVMLTTFKVKVFNPIVIVSLALTLFSIVISWSTSMLNRRLKMFIK